MWQTKGSFGRVARSFFEEERKKECRNSAEGGLGPEGDAAQQILEAGVGVEAIEYGIDGEIEQPHGMIFIVGV